MIRPARESDYDAYAVLHKTLVPDDPVPTRERYAKDLVTIQVAEVAGQVVGFVDMHVFDDVAHVRMLVVGDDARGRGIGEELMLAATRAHGIATWQLNVADGNAAATALYMKLGFQFDWRSAAILVPWVITEQLPAEPAPASPVTLANGAELEAAFRLQRGRIARLLGREGRVMIQLRAETGPIAVAGFDPRFPGTVLFRVARPALAGTLFAALRPHKLDHDYLAMLIEDDDATLALLEEAGAIVRRRIGHMTGAVP